MRLLMLLPVLWDLRSASLYRIPDLLCRYETPHALCRLDGNDRFMVADELWRNGTDYRRLSRLWSVAPTREIARVRWNDTTVAHLVSGDRAFARVGVDGAVYRCGADGTAEAYRVALDKDDFFVCCSGLVRGFSVAYTWSGRILVLNEQGSHAIGDSAPSATHRCAVDIQTRAPENGPVYAAVRFQDESFEYLRIFCDKDIGGVRLLEKRSIDPFTDRPPLRDFGVASHGHVYFLFEGGGLLVRQVNTGKTTAFRVSPGIARIVAIGNKIYGLRSERWRLIAAF